MGNDVEALFPSLDELESARIVRDAIMTSEMKFLSIDFVTALRYIRVVWGEDHIREIELTGIAPRWLR